MRSIERSKMAVCRQGKQTRHPQRISVGQKWQKTLRPLGQFPGHGNDIYFIQPPICGYSVKGMRKEWSRLIEDINAVRWCFVQPADVASINASARQWDITASRWDVGRSHRSQAHARILPEASGGSHVAEYVDPLLTVFSLGSFPKRRTFTDRMVPAVTRLTINTSSPDKELLEVGCIRMKCPFFQGFSSWRRIWEGGLKVGPEAPSNIQGIR